ncbi:MAG: isochorismatase family cysteine hydrolase [Homoserinimonas sp.]
MSELDQFSRKTVEQVRLPITAERTALILVDLVNDYLEPDGAMPVPNPQAMLAKADELVGIIREAGAMVVWVRPGHFEDDDGLFRKRIRHGFVDTEGAQIHGSLAPLSNERVMTKRRYSAFFQTDLDLYLREHRVERVIVCGVAANICVRSTVHDAFFNGYDVWFARDASQATGQREEESTVHDIQGHFGEVLTVADVRAEYSR